MYLKRLELKGFKSFPNKTDIEFKEGITSIVGPNGSGKSNISDAIRWVLGEQSIKSLRGEKLEDVIFSGSENKKPSNYCEVSLTIDNSNNEMDLEFSEITIKRRFYKNGESEFFLNNKSCRLKDIREIFLDTGIGKDGYSIIEQGKVDEILSNNPFNRRKVFDEACGISKFRYKKQEAEKNLKNTKENLERINDIFIEIENKLTPLYNQQKKALKYIELKEELKKLEVSKYIKEIDKFEKELDELNKHNSILEKQINETNQKKNLLENEYENLNSQIEEIDNYINKVNNYIISIKDTITKKEANLNLINERVSNLNSDIEKNKIELEKLEQKINYNEKEIDTINNSKIEKNENIKRLKKDLEEIEIKNSDKKNKILDISENIELKKDEIISLLDKKQIFTGNLSTASANLENIKSRKGSIDLEKNELLFFISNKEKEIEISNKNIEDISLKLDEIKKDYEKLNNNLSSLNDEKIKVEEEIQKNKYSLSEYNSKKKIYIEMENDYEGFNKGVKEVLKNKNLKGIHGALSQVIEVPFEYEKAIESALGFYMQNIITENEYVAKDAINYLKKNNLGRVTFLPIDIIKSNKINNLSTKIEFIGIASDLIKYEEKYKNIIENVLGKTIIIDNMDDAIKFAKDTKHKFKVVTLDGEILNPGGALTGGSLKTTNNILSRKRLINDYQEKIDKLNEIIDINNKNYIKLNDNIKTLNINLENINITKNDLEKNMIIEKTNSSKLSEELKSLNSSLDKLQKENENLSINLNYIKDNIFSIESEISNIEKKYSQCKKDIDDLNIKLKTFNENYEGEKDKFDSLNIELVKEVQSYESLDKDIKRLENETIDISKRKDNIFRLLNENEKNIDILNNDFINEENELINLKNELNNSNDDLKLKNISREEIKKSFDKVSSELKSIDRIYLDLKESIFKITSKIDRTKNVIDDYGLRLFEEYELTFLDAKVNFDMNLEVDKNVLDDLKSDIKKLGNINLDSIDEYKETKERYDFYIEQKTDLEQSINSIEKLIVDLEKNMKIEFEENFNKINEKFKYVYKRLFGGGEGELKIIDSENILESDIEINAKPPGKKMKSLSLLSGGEKAITAISILFSIILIKPTPFCILDEIEAPLDDANIYRYGEFLKELASSTQFIAVTHRRGTMEASDFIYGVTMQEKGVSKVISLKLNEAEEIVDII